MANMEVTNNTTRLVRVRNPEYQDKTLTAAGAVTWVAGTLLGVITASNKMTAYASGASDGSEVAVAVLDYEVEFAAAGDKSERPLVAGVVRKNDLVAHGVGAISEAESEMLRNYGIVTQDNVQLMVQDNQ